MVNNNSYFYYSGFIAISLFSFFVSLALFLMLSSDKIKTFALKKDNYISVSIDMSVSQAKKTLNSIDKPVIEEKVAPKKPKDVNIDNLFSDIWTKKIKAPKKVIKKENTRRLQEIQKKIQKVDNKKNKSVSELFKNISTAEKSKKSSKASTALEVNEYLAKIQALVYKHFFPPQNSQGNSVKAVIELSAIGKVQDFRILNYSASTELNNECDNIKSRLINVVFPKNPDNNSGSYTISLTSKE